MEESVAAGTGEQAAVGQAPPPEPAGRTALAASVVICAYTERRGGPPRAAGDSVLGQLPPPHEVILVIDYNAALADRARRELRGVTVLENAGTRGLSGARNTGLRAASQAITVFLDDDAQARPGWLASL